MEAETNRWITARNKANSHWLKKTREDMVFIRCYRICFSIINMNIIDIYPPLAVDFCQFYMS